ncbi:MAG: hybrid sensor histidine kinase/response regulator [Gammaproteobacteria bacterium]|nr:hybrid sensor histidine kinase/response regulator [Gammaproteobacteria bacterium]
MKPGKSRIGSVEILISEDSATQREQLQHLLQEHGYSVEATSNGKKALAAARRRKPTLIMTDIVMPEMDGYDLCRAIKTDEKLKDIPVVLLTTLSDARDVVLGLECGADSFIRKPYDQRYLFARIDYLIMNLELRKNQKMQMGIEISLGGQRHVITAERQQILDLLISTYEQATRINEELEVANRELRDTQAQLVQSAKMASLGQLVAGVAHEINNPLAFVMSHQQTIERNLKNILLEAEPHLSVGGRDSLDKLRQRLADSAAGLERIRELVAKLRAFSRLDEGELKQIDIEEGIESVLVLLQHKLKDRIRINRNFEGKGNVLCYPGPLNQVIMNIISNAIDAIEGQGEITVSTARTDGMFVISVADTGTGIPEADRERVFDPFFTKKPVGEGTGLGLSISYGIVKRHGGTIEVRSKEGKGTEMIVKIPLRQPAARAGEGT